MADIYKQLTLYSSSKYIPVWTRETTEDQDQCKYWIGSLQQSVADPEIIYTHITLHANTVRHTANKSL